MPAAKTAADRMSLHRRLHRRNRLVSILRFGVPALGAVVFLGLVVQIYLSSTGARYGVGRIEVTPEAVHVEAPEYAGIFDDGSTYRVWADSARAVLETSELIDLLNAYLTIHRASGVVMEIEANEARLNTVDQTVLVEGPALVTDSTGTRADLRHSTFDGATQTLSSEGPVHIEYADGTTVRAGTMVYDGSAMIWTFSRAVVTLPSTPGQSDPQESSAPQETKP